MGWQGQDATVRFRADGCGRVLDVPAAHGDGGVGRRSATARLSRKTGPGLPEPLRLASVNMRATLLTASALLLGFLLVYSAFVWWTVSGMGAIDTSDGNPPGPLHGYGVAAILVLAGLSALVFGVRRIAASRS